MRSDARRSRDAIFAAVAALLAEQGPGFTLTDAARRAEVSTATAYRHFASTDEAIAAYYEHLCAGLIKSLEAIGSGDGDAGAEAEIRAICLEWATQAADWGPAAVYVRDPRGFLDRLDAGDSFITAMYRRLADALRRAASAGVIPGDSDLRYATLV